MIERNGIDLNLKDLRHRMVAILSLMLSIVFGISSLTGKWIDNSYLPDFGVEVHLVRPLAVVGYLAIALALLVPLRSTRWVVPSLLAIPVMVVCWSALAALSASTGSVAWAYPYGHTGISAGLFERPDVATLAVLTMLALAAAVARRRRRGFNPVAAILASIALSVSCMSGLVTLLAIFPAGNESRLVLAPLPSSAQAIAIAVAVLARGGWPAWTPIPGRGTQRGKIMRRAFPGILLVPVLSALLEILIDETGAVSPIVIDLAAAAINIAVFATLIFWSISRIAAEHAALWDTTNALESAAIALTTSHGIIQHWSRGCEDLYGWSAEEAIGRSKDEMLHSQVVQSRHVLRKTDATGDQQRELIERCRDGTTVQVIERVRVVHAEGRAPVSVREMTDITQRVQIEAALRAEREQFRLILQTVPSAMMIFDEQDRIVAFSASAELMLGYAAEEAIGLDIDVLMPERDRHRWSSIVERYLADGESHVIDGTTVLQMRRRDGSAVPIDLWIGDMQIGSRRLFISFFRDLSDRISTQERLGEMHDELLHVSRLSAMGELAASLAHELNQPLAATAYFLGAADLVLEDDANREQGRALLRLGAEQTLRAGEIIRRMRGFATRDGGDMQAGPISTIIDDAVALAFVGEARYDIEIVLELDPAAEMILADRIQISQVFFNMLRNATEELRKCPPVGRRIVISTRALTPEMIEVSVADSGPGFDPVILDQLYMPFVSTKHAKGMGVGLSICRRIIEAHGGTLSAENAPGGGAIFRFTLSTTIV